MIASRQRPLIRWQDGAEATAMAATHDWLGRENRTHIGSNFHIHDVSGIYGLF